MGSYKEFPPGYNLGRKRKQIKTGGATFKSRGRESDLKVALQAH